MPTPSVKVLFPSLLQTLNYEPPQNLIDYCIQYYEKNKYRSVQRSIRLGYQSQLINIPELKPVHDYIDEHSITRGLIHGKQWININPTGGYNNSHIHPMCDYTFVYYLTHTTVPVVLTHPHLYEQVCHSYSLQKDISEKYTMDTVHSIVPKKGDILMFPSYLPHHVEVNHELEDRISISWNSDSMNVPRVFRDTPRQS